MNLPLALLWFLIGFVLINGVKVLHITRSAKKLQNLSVNPGSSSEKHLKTGYRKSLPYTPVYYLFVWLTCSTFYFSNHASVNIFTDALKTGILWWLLTLLFEMLIWVIAKHKLQLTWKEMYVNSQPWLSISYYAVLISPLILSMIIAF